MEDRDLVDSNSIRYMNTLPRVYDGSIEFWTSDGNPIFPSM